MPTDAFTTSSPRLRGRRSVSVAPAMLILLACFATDPVVAEDKPITYEDHVAGILKKHCATCHGDGKQEGGLALASYAGVMKGAGGGEIVFRKRHGPKMPQVAQACTPIYRRARSGSQASEALNSASMRAQARSASFSSYTALSGGHQPCLAL